MDTILNLITTFGLEDLFQKVGVYVTLVCTALFALQNFAAFIVAKTDTPKDDAIVAKVYRVVEFIAGIWTEKSKQLAGEAELLK